MTLRNGFTLGIWTVHPLEGRLASQEEERRVQPKSMDVLLCLVENAGEVVERDDLLRQVWGERAPSDEPLTRCIGELRRALGDNRSQPEYILTVPKRGYRLLMPVGDLESNQAASQTPSADSRPPGLLSTRSKIAAAALISVFAIALVMTLVRQESEPGEQYETPDLAAANAPQPSIVVLPFLNMSPDPDQEYFSDGITEELLNLLAKFPDLKVISRSSSFAYKGRSMDVRTVAQELHVTHVLEGSVRRSGEQVRITAQLIEASSDTHLWSETYERTLDDIFATQEEIAAKVVAELEPRLLADRPTFDEPDPEAYALYLQARYLGRQFAAESFEKAIALLEQALALDPGYAPAWDALGRMYRRQAGQGLRPIDESYALALDATQRALALDPGLASAHRSLAVIARNYDRDLAAAAGHLQQALVLDGVDAGNISNAAAMAASLGRLDQAIALQQYAFGRDPINPIINTHLGILYLHSGRLDEAIAAFRTTLILNPDYFGTHFLIGVGLLLKGDVEAALAEIEADSDEGYRLIGQVMAYHALGDTVASDAALEELIHSFETDAPYNIAYTLAYRGEADTAFAWLEKAVSYNDPGLTDILTDPLFDNIHTDPRWLPFLASIGKSPEILDAIEFDVGLPSQ